VITVLILYRRHNKRLSSELELADTDSLC